MTPQPIETGQETSGKRRRRGTTILVVAGLVIGLCCSAGLIAVIAGGKEQDRPAADDAALSNVFPPKPDEATREAYIADLNAINPEIVGDRADLVVDRGRNQCSSIKDHPDDRERLVRETNMRFTTPDHPEGFGPEIAEQILDVVWNRLCPTWGR